MATTLLSVIFCALVLSIPCPLTCLGLVGIWHAPRTSFLPLCLHSSSFLSTLSHRNTLFLRTIWSLDSQDYSFFGGRFLVIMSGTLHRRWLSNTVILTLPLRLPLHCLVCLNDLMLRVDVLGPEGFGVGGF